jgi:pilus assembly protein Flp/PilA
LHYLMENVSGQGLVEYTLIIALVAILVIVSLQVPGNKTSNTVSNAANSLSLRALVWLGMLDPLRFSR